MYLQAYYFRFLSLIRLSKINFLFSVWQYKSQISTLNPRAIKVENSGTSLSSNECFDPKSATTYLGRLSSGGVKVEHPDTVLYEEIPESIAATRVTTEIQCLDNAAYQQLGLRKNK